MQEVWGSDPRLGGLRVSPLRASEGIGTLQSGASGLQSTTQGIPSGPKDSESKIAHMKGLKKAARSRVSSEQARFRQNRTKARSRLT